MSAHNTFGYLTGLEYEHITPKGIILNAGFQYGRQRHDVDVKYMNLDFFDNVHPELLSSISDSMNYSAGARYIGMKFMVAYRWIIPATIFRGWASEGKAGFSFRISVTQNSNNILWRMAYPRNDTLFLTQFGQDVISFGKKSTLGSMAYSHNADIYFRDKQAGKMGFCKKCLNWCFFNLWDRVREIPRNRQCEIIDL